MELFEDGGLKDEGNTIDPVSGNDVPLGSTQEEVRDDIPAQLSEGEFVFPADVVRYIGLEKLMQMRQQAKMGLQTMNDMGQMGNGDEAVIPDDIPFELSDLDMEDDPVEMQEGGLLDPKLKGFNDFSNWLDFYNKQREPVPEEKSGLLDPVKSKVDSNILTRDVEQDDISNLPKTYTPATQQDVPSAPKYEGLTFKDVMPDITPDTFRRAYNIKDTTDTSTDVTEPTVTTPVEPKEPKPTTQEQDVVPPMPEVPDITPTGVTPADPSSPFDLESTSGYKGDTIAEQQKTSDEQMAQFYEGVTQEQKDAAEIAEIDPLRKEEIFNQFNNLGEIDKSKIYEAYGIEQGNFTDLLKKAGKNFIGNLSGAMISGMVGGIPGLVIGQTVGSKVKEEEPQTPEALAASQLVNRERAAMALGTEMTGNVGHDKGDIEPRTGYIYNRYGVPINPATGDASTKIMFSDLDSWQKSLQANGKSGWRGGYIGTKDSPRYKNLNDTQRKLYDNYVQELDKLYGFTDEPITYGTSQQIIGRPIDQDDADAGGSTPPPDLPKPAMSYDQQMQELDFEDADMGTEYTPPYVSPIADATVTATSNKKSEPSIVTTPYEQQMQELDLEDEDIGTPETREEAFTRMMAEEEAIKEANRIRQEEIKEEARQKAQAAAVAAEVARMKRLEEQRIANAKAEAKRIADAKAKAARDKARKQDKKDKEKKEKQAKAVAKSRESEAKGGRRTTYARGFKEGGLASKPKQKPKQMRSGGLASR